MDISLIVPCHNLEEFISPLLSSLSRQKIQCKAEIIFILDHCTDNTEKLVHDWKLPQFAEVTICSTNWLKAGLARNEGISRAKGTYIWFIDGDDWLIPDNAVQLAYEIGELSASPVSRFKYETDTFPFPFHPSMVWQYVFEKEFLNDIKFGAEEHDEDVTFMKKVYAKLGGKPPCFPAPLYFYHYGRKGSLTTLLRLERLKDTNGEN